MVMGFPRPDTPRPLAAGRPTNQPPPSRRVELQQHPRPRESTRDRPTSRPKRPRLRTGESANGIYLRTTRRSGATARRTRGPIVTKLAKFTPDVAEATQWRK